MKTLTRNAALTLFGLILLADSGAAQLVTDTVPRTRTVPIEETVERQVTEARYRLGPIRVQPTFLLRNLGYNDNVFGATDSAEAVDDWTATVGAGVDAWLPFGPKMILASTLRPEYTWYKDNDQLSRMGGYYDAAAYGFFNRLRLEARALTEDTQTIVSSELQATARRETQGLSGRAEIEILRRLSVFAGADQRTFEHENPDVEGVGYDVTRLDRDDSAMRAGVRYAWRSWFDVSAMVEKTETEFDTTPELRDNESDAVLVGVHYDRPQFFVNLVGGQRDGTPLNGSSFPEYSTWTGSYFMQYRLTAPIDVEVFGGRDVAYAIGATDPYFFETRNGAALRFQLGRSLSTRIFGETGTNDYTELPGNAREDDVTRVGASLSVPVWRTLALTVTAAQDDYESNIPGFDRSVLRWGATVGLRSLIFR